jgi:hypothetical protein
MCARIVVLKTCVAGIETHPNSIRLAGRSVPPDELWLKRDLIIRRSDDRIPTVASINASCREIREFHDAARTRRGVHAAAAKII